MSGKHSGQLMKTGFLKGAKARVLLALASFANVDGQSWHSLDSIAHHARCTKKTTINAIKWLERYDVLKVYRGRNGRAICGDLIGSTNLYTLNLKFIESLVDITNAMHRYTAGSAATKCAAARKAASAIEELIVSYNLDRVMEISNYKPGEIRQVMILEIAKLRQAQSECHV